MGIHVVAGKRFGCSVKNVCMKFYREGSKSSSSSVVDIDTGLMICNASHKNIFLGEPITVSGQPSKRQLITCWIRAPPLGGGDHVT